MLVRRRAVFQIEDQNLVPSRRQIGLITVGEVVQRCEDPASAERRTLDAKRLRPADNARRSGTAGTSLHSYGRMVWPTSTPLRVLLLRTSRTSPIDLQKWHPWGTCDVIRVRPSLLDQVIIASASGHRVVRECKHGLVCLAGPLRPCTDEAPPSDRRSFRPSISVGDALQRN